MCILVIKIMTINYDYMTYGLFRAVTWEDVDRFTFMTVDCLKAECWNKLLPKLLKDNGLHIHIKHLKVQTNPELSQMCIDIYKSNSVSNAIHVFGKLTYLQFGHCRQYPQCSASCWPQQLPPQHIGSHACDLDREIHIEVSTNTYAYPMLLLQ